MREEGGAGRQGEHLSIAKRRTFTLLGERNSKAVSGCRGESTSGS